MPKNEPKRLKQPQERYVAQQETYRNSPAFHPEARPVDTTVQSAPIKPMDTRKIPRTLVKEPELPAPVQQTAQSARPTQPAEVVQGKSKLDLLLETFSIVEPAIKAYVGYQNKLADINQKEQRARAILGLDQTHGRGLGWGSDEGYSLGSGEADGIKIKAEFSEALKANNYFSEYADNPEIAQQKTQELYSEISKKYMRDTSNNAYMLGMSNHVIEAKLDGELKVNEALMQERSMRNLENAAATVEDEITKILESDAEPTILRSRIKATADSTNIPITAANELFLKVGFNKANDLMDRGNFSAADKLVSVLGSQDKDGISFAKTKNKRSFDQYMKEYRTEKRRILNETHQENERLYDNQKELLIAKANGNPDALKALTDMSFAEGTLDAKRRNQLIKIINDNDAGYFPQDLKLQGSLYQDASKGNLQNPSDLLKLVSDRKISMSFYEKLISKDSAVKRQRDTDARVLGNMAKSNKLMEQRMVREETDQNYRFNKNYFDSYMKYYSEAYKDAPSDQKEQWARQKAKMLEWDAYVNAEPRETYLELFKNKWGAVPELAPGKTQGELNQIINEKGDEAGFDALNVELKNKALMDSQRINPNETNDDEGGEL